MPVSHPECIPSIVRATVLTHFSINAKSKVSSKYHLKQVWRKYDVSFIEAKVLSRQECPSKIQVGQTQNRHFYPKREKLERKGWQGLCEPQI